MRSLLTDKQEEMDAWGIYRSANTDHPCNVWLRESRWNVYWVTRYTFEIERVRLKAGLNPHESAEVLRNLTLFQGEHQLELHSKYTFKHKDDYTVPFLVMDDSLQYIYGVPDTPKKKKREKVRWRGNTWGHVQQAYQSFIPSSVFKDGSVPTWDINGRPAWLKVDN
jgi:hypothetical protein